MKDDELRAMFEAHCAKIYPNFGFKRFSSDMQTYSGQYTDSRVNTRWEAWQACHAAMQGEDVRRDAERWRFFCDNIGSAYGDGYTEPREQSACLEWQQGPWIRDGSNGGQGRADTFPGWSAIIDKMMEDEQRALEELDEPTDTAMGERHE